VENIEKLTFYGGVDEIGGNKILLETNCGSVFFDFGLSYKKQGRFFEEFLQPRTNSKFYDLQRLGLLPRLDGVYRQDALQPIGLNCSCTPTMQYWEDNQKCYEESCRENLWHPDGIFISHAHADHMGHVPFLSNIPVYCSDETRKIMKAISQIGNMDGYDGDLTEIEYREIKTQGPKACFPGSFKIDRQEPLEREFKILNSGVKKEIAPGLDITSFDVGHSIPGSMCALVDMGDKRMLYTGDLRFHGRFQPDLSDLYDSRPDVMICEGTRISEQIPDDETRVQNDLTELIEETEGLVMVGFAWRDLERYETVKNAALSVGRTPIFDSRVAYLLARLGIDIYSEGASVFLERTDSLLYSPSDYMNGKHNLGPMDEDFWSSKEPRVVDTTHLERGIKAYEIQKDPTKYVLHLDYYRFKNLLDLNPPSGSSYVRAQCEPFDPEMKFSENRMINWLEHFEINKTNHYKPHQIHASGHASGKELIEFIDKIKPKNLVPIHTERPNLFKNKSGKITLPKTNYSIKIT
jgi:ribonuclease J